ncbi:hypothetical protein, partial [Legionella pneumophila]
ISSDQTGLAEYLRSRSTDKSKLTDTLVDEIDSTSKVGKQLEANGLFKKKKRQTDREPQILFNPAI